MPERILLVDDEDKQRVPLRGILESWGYEVEDCASAKDALGRVGVFLPSVVITDLVMPGGSGIDLIREIRNDYRGSIIVLSGKGTIEKAVEALKEGADDFLEKPLNFQKLRVVLDKMRKKNEIVEENRRLRELLAREGTFGRLRGRSRKMLEVYSVIEQVAPSQIPVLITGESGTGKELVARTIHELSTRRKGPFVAINAAAIPRELIESELFGHERGAFTGAIARKTGCFEMAHNGTLFLDEIAEMEESTQAKLLRVLQEQNFRRIGGSELIHSEVRVVAATNRDPKQAMADRKLRKDLYYRLAVMTIHLPPLRERADDITLLARAFADEVCETVGKKRCDFAAETMELLAQYRWPGNVRELRNAIERALVLTGGPSILPDQLPAELLAEVGYEGPSVSPTADRTLLAAMQAASRPADGGGRASSSEAGNRGARPGAGAPQRHPGEPVGVSAATGVAPSATDAGGGSAGAGFGFQAGGYEGGAAAAPSGAEARSADGGLAPPGDGAPASTEISGGTAGGTGPSGTMAAPPESAMTIPLGVSAAEVEKELIRRTLEMTKGNKTKAAKILDLSLKTVHNKIKKYGL